MLEKLNHGLVRSGCGSTMVGTAGDGSLEVEDEELAFVKLSKSRNDEKSLVSRTKGEGSRGLSSNMARRSEQGDTPAIGHVCLLVCLLITSAQRPIPSSSRPQTMNVTDLNAQIFQRLHPKAYLERFLAEQLRLDGREASDWRDLFVNVGSISTADGSALVRLGETTIVCGVKAEIAEPDLGQPSEGFLGSYLPLLDHLTATLTRPPPKSRTSTFQRCARHGSSQALHPRRLRSSLIVLRRRSPRAPHLSTLPCPRPDNSLSQLGHSPPLSTMHTPRVRCVGAVRRCDMH